MSKRVNLVLEDEVKESLDRWIPAGRRSSFVNSAIRTQLDRLQRQRAVQELEEHRRHGPPVSTAEIVRLIREDRGRIH